MKSTFSFLTKALKRVQFYTTTLYIQGLSIEARIFVCTPEALTSPESFDGILCSCVKNTVGSVHFQTVTCARFTGLKYELFVLEIMCRRDSNDFS